MENQSQISKSNNIKKKGSAGGVVLPKPKQQQIHKKLTQIQTPTKSAPLTSKSKHSLSEEDDNLELAEFTIAADQVKKDMSETPTAFTTTTTTTQLKTSPALDKDKNKNKSKNKSKSKNESEKKTHQEYTIGEKEDENQGFEIIDDNDDDDMDEMAESTTDDDQGDSIELDENSMRTSPENAPLVSVKLNLKREVWKNKQDREAAKKLKSALKSLPQPLDFSISDHFKEFVQVINLASQIQHPANSARRLDEIMNVFYEVPRTWLTSEITNGTKQSLLQHLVASNLQEIFTMILFRLNRFPIAMKQNKSTLIWNIKHVDSLGKNFLHTLFATLDGASREQKISCINFWNLIQTSPLWYQNMKSEFENALLVQDIVKKTPLDYIADSIESKILFTVWKPQNMKKFLPEGVSAKKKIKEKQGEKESRGMSEGDEGAFSLERKLTKARKTIRSQKIDEALEKAISGE